MSKKIKLSIPVEVIVRDRDVRLLAQIEQLQPARGGYTNVGLGQLARQLGSSVDTTRRAIASSRAEGYLESCTNHLENGAQLENGYRVTERGRKIITSARNAGII